MPEFENIKQSMANTSNKTRQPYNYRTFEEARAFVHSLGLRSSREWRVWTKSGNKPKDIPADPRNTYKDTGWKGWGDWLGTGTIANQNRSYRSFVLNLSGESLLG